MAQELFMWLMPGITAFVRLNNKPPTDQYWPGNYIDYRYYIIGIIKFEIFVNQKPIFHSADGLLL
jgi:hypothetical protein